MLSIFSNMDQAEDVYLLMMDADGFKQINDHHGHVEGDHALQVISTVLKDVCSASGGFIARYGGDEFVVLQKGSSRAGHHTPVHGNQRRACSCRGTVSVAHVHRLRAGR